MGKTEIILTLAILLYIVYFTLASFLRYDNFYTGRYDLGNMDQTVWNTVNGRIFQTTEDGGAITSRLAGHADFLLIILSPFYLIWSHPKMLLLIQSLVLGLGGLFIYLIGQNALKNKNLSLALTISYLLYPALQFTNLYDFHAVTLSTTLLLGAFYFLRKGRCVLFLLFLLLASLGKEQVWLISALFGLYAVILKPKVKLKLLGLAVFLSSILIFYYLIWQAIPSAFGKQHFALSYYSEFGDSPTRIIQNIFFSWGKIINLLSGDGRLSYLFNLFLPLGLLSLFSPLYLIFALPDFAINLLSNNPLLRQVYYQYSSNITPFIFISAIFGIKNLMKWFPKIPLNLYTAHLLFLTLTSAYFLGPLPGAKNSNIKMFTEPLPNREAVDGFLSKIPKKYTVAATNNLGSHLSQRQKIFTIPVGIDQADIVVFLLNDSFAQPSLSAQKEMAGKMEKDRNYTVIFKLDDFVAFKRRGLSL